MAADTASFTGSRITRRGFLKTSAGVVALTVLGAPVLRQARAAESKGHDWAPSPGVARQRIDGFDKVTGAKVYARDFNARDMTTPDGTPWPETQWYGMYLRALTTTRAFLDIDRAALPAATRDAKVILGSDLAEAQITPALSLGRDLAVDLRIEEEILAEETAMAGAALTTSSGGTGDDDRDFDRPKSVEFDLIVRPGNRPDFLGQAVALLLFRDLPSYRAARRQMQFDDARFQVYGPEIGPNPDEPRIFQPETLYVRAPEKDDPDRYFSYFTAPDPKTYVQDAAPYAEEIDTFLATNPDLIAHDFTCDMQAMDPVFMEPESGLIWYERAAETLHMVLGTQSPDGDVADICSMYDQAGARLTVKQAVLTSCYPGGGFGGRDSSPFSLMLGICADFAEGHPVKLEYDRFEQFRVGLKRHACDLNGTLAMTPDQQIQVVKMNMTFDGGGRRNLSPYVASLAALCAGGSYRVPRANIFAHAIHSQNVSGGSQRGFGGPQAFFAIETALDEICAEQGWDPFEVRLKNAFADIAPDGCGLNEETTVVGGRINQSLRLEQMLETARAHPLWANREAIREGHRQRGQTYGTGVAMSLQAYGTSGDGVVAAIMLEKDGSYTLRSDAVDMGNGSATTMGVVISDILGANARVVQTGDNLLFSETGLTTNSKILCDPPPDHGAQKDPPPLWSDATFTKKGVGSSSACLTGLHQVHVVQQCAHALFAQVILPVARLAWDLPDLQPDDTYWQDGMLMTDGFDPLPLVEIAGYVHDRAPYCGALAHAYFEERWITADFDTATGTRTFQLDGLAFYPTAGGKPDAVWRSNTRCMPDDSKRASRYVWAPCVNVIGLTVDRATGTTRIENVVSVLNAGKIHVPELVSGQSQGGVAMAISYTLFEDMPPGMDGPANGTWNLNRYHVARYADVPLATEYSEGGRSQDLILMDAKDCGETSGRGIAEAVMCSIAPAISNALRDAVGVRFTSMPITADKIRKGLRT